MAAMIITQLVYRQASFLGHLSGMLAGVMVASGLLDWCLQPYWVAWGCAWGTAVLLVSLKATTNLPVPFVDYVNIRHAIHRRAGAVDVV
eukprot:CAMPEP_0113948374 /NCGR_PEP_ID=MMETSP1339-20121228/70036_1 /TAXON_ID=94617 /ORGANISM="Fibrocapsa japonica" /LENGTH=88 /DNA_ID=CAMNT_0000955419 /DNA_START=652 /DNA_END=918 /DNA_ORIENTATION=+ /assembly_acc=CAM_ASM_000762